MFRTLTVADVILLLVLVLTIVFGFIGVGDTPDHGSAVTVEVNNSTVFTTALDHPETFSIDGTQGAILFEIAEGSIRAVRADCPNQICVRTGWRRKAGDIIVCVPNKTIVRISGENEEAIEAVTG